MIKRVVLVTAAVLVSAAVPAQAGDTKTFGAGPTGKRSAIGVPESGTLRDSLEVRNHTGSPITLKLYAASATVNASGAVAIGFRGSAAGGLSKRLQVPASVRVPARSVRVVTITADVDGLAKAERTGAVVVEGPPSSAGSALDLVERIAVLVRPGAPVGGTAVTSGKAGRPGYLPLLLLLPALVAGWWLFLLWKRRRKDEEEKHAAARASAASLAAGRPPSAAEPRQDGPIAVRRSA